jgi:hypothetical protein
MAAFLRIRIVNIGLFFSLSRLRVVQSHDSGTKFAFTFEHLKGTVLALPESNRGCRIGCLNCGRSKPTGDQHEEQIGKSRCIHRFVLGSQLGPSRSGLLRRVTGRLLVSVLDNTPHLSSREDRLTNMTSFVRIDDFSNTLRDALLLFLSMTTADLLSTCKTTRRGYGRSISLSFGQDLNRYYCAALLVQPMPFRE